QFRARKTVDEAIAVDDGQPDTAVRLGVADDGLWLSAAEDDLSLLEHLPPHHDHPAVALTEVLLRAIGHGALADPGHEVLVHDVGGDPPAGEGIHNRTDPIGNALLLERLHLVRHPIEEPAHARRAPVIDRHTPFEMAAREQAVRPQTGAPNRPELVRLRLPLEDAAVDEAVLELVEANLEVRGGFWPVDAAKDSRPVAVQPLEV